MLAQAYVSHICSDRLRIRIPEKRKDSDYFNKIQKTLKKHSFDVQVTPLTGSVLIESYESVEKIQGLTQELGLFDLEVSQDLNKKSSTVKKSSGIEDIVQHPWFATGLIGLGALQILRGQPLAASSTLFMDAFRLLTSKRSS